MKIFLTGASGYIGGSVAAALTARGDTVRGLVRSQDKAEAVRALGIAPVLGTLDDLDTLRAETRAADAAIHTASADHADSIRAIMDALEGTGKRLIHTSGSSIVGTQAMGEFLDPVYEDDTPFVPSPGRADRTALTWEVRDSHARGVHTIVIAPALIYGPGRGAGAHSMQVPWLIETARRHGHPRHLGPGENRWSNVHIDDLVDLYLLALDHAPAGSFYWAENGEASMAELAASIGRMMGQDGTTRPMTAEEAAAEWGEGPAINTMGSNSRVRARRARAELGWSPHRTSVVEEIERGCYAP